MRTVTRPLAGLLVLTLALGACQDPGGDASGTPAGPPGASPGTPIAPAIETDQPDAELTFPLPSPAPVAPKVEPEPSGPEPTVGGG